MLVDIVVVSASHQSRRYPHGGHGHKTEVSGHGGEEEHPGGGGVLRSFCRSTVKTCRVV